MGQEKAFQKENYFKFIYSFKHVNCRLLKCSHLDSSIHSVRSPPKKVKTPKILNQNKFDSLAIEYRYSV